VRRAVDPVTLALALALGTGWLGFPGLLWDVAWHRTIGRDSFLSPPHVLMYTGVLVNGLVSAWAVVWGRRHGAPAGFRLGAAGFLLAVAGALLDEWWHAYVGKDVNLWSPPHLVGLAGTALIAVGLLFALAAHTRYGLAPRWRAPRALVVFGLADLVHKSMVALDHYTLDACTVSQFEQQVRAVCGLPLGEARLLCPAAMVNLIGDDLTRALSGEALRGLLRTAGAKLRVYGKKTIRPGRKMGHVTFLAEKGETAREAAATFRRVLTGK